MRVWGTFVNFGSASENLYWQGHVMRTAWRGRQRRAAGQSNSARAPQQERSVLRSQPALKPCGR